MLHFFHHISLHISHHHSARAEHVPFKDYIAAMGRCDTNIGYVDVQVALAKVDTMEHMSMDIVDM